MDFHEIIKFPSQNQLRYLHCLEHDLDSSPSPLIQSVLSWKHEKLISRYNPYSEFFSKMVQKKANAIKHSNYLRKILFVPMTMRKFDIGTISSPSCLEINRNTYDFRIL